mmetsp:Transcript_50102/g.98686  ORF Transcript_50102/g.98686 Transcript_50102/m.98686 type:complete len:98 (+) Transcript_50102:1844-2137(+)
MHSSTVCCPCKDRKKDKEGTREDYTLPARTSVKLKGNPPRALRSSPSFKRSSHSNQAHQSIRREHTETLPSLSFQHSPLASIYPAEGPMQGGKRKCF